MIKKIPLLLIALFTFLFSTPAQSQNLMSGTYQGVYFMDMVDDLESRYDLKFFFDPKLDSTKVDLTFSNVSLEKLLSDITALSNINFLVKDKNRRTRHRGFSFQKRTFGWGSYRSVWLFLF